MPTEMRRARKAHTRPTTQVWTFSHPFPTCANKATEDERSIANRLNAAEPQNEKQDEGESGKASAEDKLAQEDPLAPARAHGNEPSKGAKIDAQIQDEEAELIAKMDAKKAAKKGN